MSHHVVPIRVYAGVILALMVLTVFTVWIAFQDLSDPWNDVIAVSVAVTKATLVVLFFMHVKYSTRLTWLVVLGAVLFLLILILMIASDVMTRGMVG